MPAAAAEPASVSGSGAAAEPAPEPVARSAPRSAPPQQPRQQVPWQPPRAEPPEWLTAVSAADPAAVRPATLWSVLATALFSAVLLGDGLGLSLLLTALPAALAAFFAAQAAGRRLRPWTAVWGLGGLALLVVPALRDAGWPVFLAVLSALACGSLVLHGGRTWLGVLVGPLGIFGSLGSGMGWAWKGLRDRADGSKERWGPIVRTTAVAAVLLLVFGARSRAPMPPSPTCSAGWRPTSRSRTAPGGSSSSSSACSAPSRRRTPPPRRCAGTGSSSNRDARAGGWNGRFR